MFQRHRIELDYQSAATFCVFRMLNMDRLAHFKELDLYKLANNVAVKL